METSYFELFRIVPRFSLGTESLEIAYYTILNEVHPDRFAQTDEPARMRALASAATANEAYRTLKKPLLRARYLLKMRGIETGAGATLSPSLLMRQMEWREALAEAVASRDEQALATLASEVKSRAHTLEELVEAQLDFNSDDAGAARSVEEWLFVEKLLAAIEDARAALEF